MTQFGFHGCTFKLLRNTCVHTTVFSFVQNCEKVSNSNTVKRRKLAWFGHVDKKYILFGVFEKFHSVFI